MARRQRHELVAPNEKECIGADEESAGLPLNESCEGGVDLVFGGDVQNNDLYSLRTCRFLHLADNALGTWTARIHEQTHYPGLRGQLGQQFEQFGHQLDAHAAHTCEIASGPGETGDQAGRDWIAAEKDDRDR